MKLYKIKNKPTIYEVGEGVARPFLGEKPFLEKGYEFGQEEVISPEQFAQYKMGQPYGAEYLKTPETPTVYRATGGQIRPIESEEVFRQLTGGLDWSKVATISPALLGQYQMGKMITPEAFQPTPTITPTATPPSPISKIVEPTKAAPLGEQATPEYMKSIYKAYLGEEYEPGEGQTWESIAEHHRTRGTSLVRLTEWLKKPETLAAAKTELAERKKAVTPTEPVVPEEKKLQPEIQTALTDIKNILAEVQKETATLETEKKGLLTRITEAIKGAPTTPTEREAMYKKYGVTEKEAELAEWDKKITEASTRYEKAYLDVAKQPIRYEAIVGQQGLVRRMEAAELKGLAAMRDAIAGNLDRATTRAKEALNDVIAVEQANVEAMTVELQALGEARTFAEQQKQTMLQYTLTKEQARLDREIELADQKRELMVEYPNADIRATDTWETIVGKLRSIMSQPDIQDYLKSIGYVQNPFTGELEPTLEREKFEAPPVYKPTEKAPTYKTVGGELYRLDETTGKWIKEIGKAPEITLTGKFNDAKEIVRANTKKAWLGKNRTLEDVSQDELINSIRGITGLSVTDIQRLITEVLDEEYK